nr:hypothetical protein [Pandoravirus massiliensis]
MQGKNKQKAGQGATRGPCSARLRSGVPRTYLVPIRKRVASPAAVLALFEARDGVDDRANQHGQEDVDCDAATTTVVTFVRLTKAQMARGRQRAWEERCARRRARSKPPVPASQTCDRCKATVYGAADTCPPCGATLAHVVGVTGTAVEDVNN